MGKFRHAKFFEPLSFLLSPRELLKATNERQDDGAGILHRVAQFTIDRVYFIYTRRPCPSPPTQDPERQGTGCSQVGLYVPLITKG